MKDYARQISLNLLSIHKKHLVCHQDTALCIEGYPRSANTFCVDFFNYLCKSNNMEFSMAHHTHSPINVELAIYLEKPCLILIREPLSAISSYTIYKGLKTSMAARRYLNFYQAIDTWSKFVLIADFNVIVDNINRVITRLNKQFDLDIPLSRDLDKDRDRVSMIAKQRAREQHSNDLSRLIRTVGSPNPEREKLKARIIPEVKDYISANSEVQHLYDAIRKLDNYLG